jgi:hypothetical protein
MRAPQIIETARLRLRRMRPDDATIMFEDRVIRPGTCIAIAASIYSAADADAPCCELRAEQMLLQQLYSAAHPLKRAMP